MKDVILYRRREDNSIAIQTVNRGGFNSADDFNEAIDFYLSQGYVEDLKDLEV